MLASDQGSIPFSYTKAPFWENKKVYSFWVLQLLTILPTGFFGLDHLFLRSPLTALAKAFLNIFTLGFWYFYDILQVTLDRDTVKAVGLSVPFPWVAMFGSHGAGGIASGMFLGPGEKSDDDAVSPWRYVIYALLTFLPLGFDHFIAGDFVGGGIKFLATISIILLPLALLWGCFNMYRAWIRPADLFKKGIYRIWPFSMVVGSTFPVKGVLGPGRPEDEDPACSSGGIIGLAADIILDPIKTAVNGIAEIPAAVVVPLQVAVKEGLAPTVTAGLKVGQLVPQVINGVPELAANVSSKLEAVSDLDAILRKSKEPLGVTGVLGSGANVMGLAAKATTAVLQGGGGAAISAPFSDGALLFTLALLVFGGGILTLIRSREDGRPQGSKENDTPPNPRAVRRTPPTE